MCPLETTSGPSMVSDLKMVNMMEGSSVVPVNSVPTHVSYNTMITE